LLATASQLQVLANAQLEDARRTAFEVLKIVGHASVTQPWTALDGILLDSTQARELMDSLIEFINTSDLEDCLQEGQVYSSRGLQQAFTDFEGLPSASGSEEEQEEEEESEEEAIKLPEIQMDVDVVSPPRRLLPPRLTSSSRQPPALSPSICMRSLRSHKSLPLSSVSSSGVGGSAQSGISPSSKKRSKFYFSLFSSNMKTQIVD
jgi:hypothetical protein